MEERRNTRLSPQRRDVLLPRADQAIFLQDSPGLLLELSFRPLHQIVFVPLVELLDVFFGHRRDRGVRLLRQDLLATHAPLCCFLIDELLADDFVEHLLLPLKDALFQLIDLLPADGLIQPFLLYLGGHPKPAIGSRRSRH